MGARFIAVAAVVLLTMAGPASATLVNVTFQGTVTRSQDRTGIFGIEHTVTTTDGYVGLSYSATYLVDTSLGEYSGSPASWSLFGGSGAGNGFASPILGVTFAVNGHDVSLAGVDSAEIGSFPLGAYLVGSGMDGGLPFFLQNAFDLPGASGALGFDAPLQLDLTGMTQSSTFRYGNAKVAKKGEDPTFLLVEGDLSSLTIATVAAVPELSTWAMLIAGFVTLGAMGSRLRRDRRAAVAA